MKAGELRHRITIQRSVPDRSEFGAEIDRWSDVATVCAAVEPLSGREYLAAQQAAADITIRVRIRYLSGLEPKMRILFGTRTLEIVSIIDLEARRREVVLMCREIL